MDATSPISKCERKRTKLYDCGCKLCDMDTPDSLNSTHPTWYSMLQVSFYCLHEMSTDDDFISLLEDVYPFVESHWKKLNAAQKLPSEYKKKILDTLNQNKKLFENEDGARDAVYWRMKKLLDPWKNSYAMSAGNLYTQTKRPKTTNNNYWSNKDSKKQKTSTSENYVPDDLEDEFLSLKEFSQAKIENMKKEITSLRSELHMCDERNAAHIRRLSEAAGNWEEAYDKMDSLETLFMKKENEFSKKKKDLQGKIESAKRLLINNAKVVENFDVFQKTLILGKSEKELQFQILGGENEKENITRSSPAAIQDKDSQIGDRCA